MMLQQYFKAVFHVKIMKPVPEIFFSYQYLGAQNIKFLKLMGISIDKLNLANRSKKLPGCNGIEFFRNIDQTPARCNSPRGNQYNFFTLFFYFSNLFNQVAYPFQIRQAILLGKHI